MAVVDVFGMSLHSTFQCCTIGSVRYCIDRNLASLSCVVFALALALFALCLM